MNRFLALPVSRFTASDDGIRHYWLSETKADWMEASEFCRLSGARHRLASPRSAVQHVCLQQARRSTCVWVGVHKSTVDGQWHFDDETAGTVADNGNWTVGQPSDTRTPQNCARARRRNGANGWDNDECQHRLYFVCQFKRALNLPPARSLVSLWPFAPQETETPTSRRVDLQPKTSTALETHPEETRLGKKIAEV